MTTSITTLESVARERHDELAFRVRGACSEIEQLDVQHANVRQRMMQQLEAATQRQQALRLAYGDIATAPDVFLEKAWKTSPKIQEGFGGDINAWKALAAGDPKAVIDLLFPNK